MLTRKKYVFTLLNPNHKIIMKFLRLRYIIFFLVSEKYGTTLQISSV